ncbi:uncharacterized protein PHALS_13238 [Plasmopara halstedii]|uniref:Uncharacterized protein n=1 Tax=Plasmopara halstedii TaxID=4781 RepID=A0A0P1APH0_PLAHL|nr:uncharacterized protein PHALS_13238 [Plasmopara halstedii]CEG43013.1 hypothetical protein PHALS_13238 [Plasmopara halstedii]|eukprot:XP_024579382.1 hypothetical protein PHALS_13238 [Plasmopara halstedii]
MEHLRVFGSTGYARVEDGKLKGYRVYDLESNRLKLSRSLRLDKREVSGIYDTAVPNHSTIVPVTKEVDDLVQHEDVQPWVEPTVDEPLPPAEEGLGGDDVKMQEVEAEPSSTSRELMTYRRSSRLTTGDNMVFHPWTDRACQAETPMLLLNDGSPNHESVIAESTSNDEYPSTNSDPDNDDHFWPPSPKRRA